MLFRSRSLEVNYGLASCIPRGDGDGDEWENSVINHWSIFAMLGQHIVVAGGVHGSGIIIGRYFQVQWSYPRAAFAWRQRMYQIPICGLFEMHTVATAADTVVSDP